MLVWMLLGIGVAAAIAVKVLISAEVDDKRRKRTRRAPVAGRRPLRRLRLPLT
ncbi:MAG TPA: hypothetical protein VM534_08705 [Thermoanaerobaculia bacterium]|nr:hypothetical protein [Thermoanaerobaculia bacterium]